MDFPKIWKIMICSPSACCRRSWKYIARYLACSWRFWLCNEDFARHGVFCWAKVDHCQWHSWHFTSWSHQCSNRGQEILASHRWELKLAQDHNLNLYGCRDLSWVQSSITHEDEGRAICHLLAFHYPQCCRKELAKVSFVPEGGILNCNCNYHFEGLAQCSFGSFANFCSSGGTVHFGYAIGMHEIS